MELKWYVGIRAKDKLHYSQYKIFKVMPFWKFLFLWAQMTPQGLSIFQLARAS